MFPDCARGGEDAGVLRVARQWVRIFGGGLLDGWMDGGGCTSLGMALVLLFAPSASAAWVVWSAMPGVDVVEEPKSWSCRGCVDLGIFKSPTIYQRYVRGEFVGRVGLTILTGSVLRSFYIHVPLLRPCAARLRHDVVKGGDVKMRAWDRHVRLAFLYDELRVSMMCIDVP